MGESTGKRKQQSSNTGKQSRQQHFPTLIHALQHHSETSQNGITFITEQGDISLSYKELYSEAKKVLYVLQERGLKPDDKVILQLTEPIEFIKIFWACLLGGFVPVPLTVRGNSEHIMKLFRVWDNLEGDNRYIIMPAELIEKLQNFSKNNNLNNYKDVFQNILPCAHLFTNNTESNDIYRTSQSKLAYLQYSSGTTGYPKGVMLSYLNLQTNIYAIISSAKISTNDSFLSWMPLTHDMGLVGLHLMPTVFGINHYIMSPLQFLKNPLLWMEKISQYNITNTASPNFGYHYFLNHFNKTSGINWDLSSINHIFNGAEPISYDLCLLFLDELKPYGIKRTSIYPVYGLAEATLAVTFPPVEEEPQKHIVDRFSLGIGQTVSLYKEDNYNTVSLVDVGFPIENCNIRITDENNTILKEKTVGYIQISGDNVTRGYYKNKVDTKNLISNDNWLNTGDLGFIKDKRLIITGRAKDIIFINGQNYYSHDIERITLSINGIDLGKIAATGFFNENNHTDDLIIFIQYPLINLNKIASLVVKIKQLIFEQLGIEVRHVIPVSKIFKTTSGKLQRHTLLEKYIKGEYNQTIELLLPLLKDSNDFSNFSINSINNNQVNDFIEFKIQKITSLLENDILNIFRSIINKKNVILTFGDNLKDTGLTGDKFILINKIIYKKYNFQISYKEYSGLHTIQNFIDHLYNNNEQAIFNYYYDIKKYIKITTANILKIEEKDLLHNTDFTFYGITSLQGIKLSNALKEHFGNCIKNDAVFQHRTVDSLTKAICYQLTENLVTEITNQAHLTKTGTTRTIVSNIKTTNIFLTGPTGILGGHLILELLKKSDSKIYCLTRAKNTAEAQKRIVEILDIYAPDNSYREKLKKHVVPVTGDISKDKLGIAPKTYQELVKKTDMVIHAAAKTSLHGLYSQLKAVNVTGTKHIINFTKQTGQKYLVFISSYSIMGDRAYRLCKPFTENDFDLGQSFEHLGYAQTKYESEYEIRTTQNSELRWLIIRPGNILGDSKTGRYPFNLTSTAGIFYDIFKTDIEKKFAMNNPSFFDITPVDYVSSAIIFLSLQYNKTNKTYHLVNNDHKRFYEIIYMIKDYGYEIELLSTENYLEKLYSNQFQKDGKDYHSMAQDLFKFNPIILDRQLHNTETCYADNKITDSILKQNNIICPRIDKQLLKTYLDYCRQIQYLPDPEQIKTNTIKKNIFMNNYINKKKLNNTSVPPINHKDIKIDT